MEEIAEIQNDVGVWNPLATFQSKLHSTRSIFSVEFSFTLFKRKNLSSKTKNIQYDDELPLEFVSIIKEILQLVE